MLREGLRHRLASIEVITGAAALPQYRLYSTPDGAITCHQQISTSVLLSSTSKDALHTISPGSSAGSGILSTLESKGSRPPPQPPHR